MLADFFFDMPSELMTAMGTVLGFALLGDMTALQQNSLGNFLMLIAQILETNSSQKQLLEARQSAQTMAEMQDAIQQLQQELDRLKGQPPSA